MDERDVLAWLREGLNRPGMLEALEQSRDEGDVLARELLWVAERLGLWRDQPAGSGPRPSSGG